MANFFNRFLNLNDQHVSLLEEHSKLQPER